MILDDLEDEELDDTPLVNPPTAEESSRITRSRQSRQLFFIQEELHHH